MLVLLLLPPPPLLLLEAMKAPTPPPMPPSTSNVTSARIMLRRRRRRARGDGGSLGAAAGGGGAGLGAPVLSVGLAGLEAPTRVETRVSIRRPGVPGCHRVPLLPLGVPAPLARSASSSEASSKGLRREPLVSCGKQGVGHIYWISMSLREQGPTADVAGQGWAPDLAWDRWTGKGLPGA